MKEYTHSAYNLNSLIDEQIYSGYTQQQQDQELLECNTNNDLPTCYFCNKEITQDQSINLHHPTYKSRGGIHVEPAHEKCHVEYHSRKGDFKQWGRQSAASRRWAFNLKNVRDNPAYEFDRQYYLMLYGQ